MRSVRLVIAAVLVLGCLAEAGGQTAAVEQYVWERVIDSGKGCFEYQNCPDDRWAMAIVPLATPDKLHLVGRKSIWSSSDGVSWNRNAKTDWGERHGMTYAYFRDELWMTGGMRSWDRFHNDVWRSSNGTDWNLSTAAAAWPARRNHSLVVFDNKLWVIGGAESSGRADKTPTRFYNDVWSSADGVRWKRATSNAGWAGRDGQHAVVFDNKLWLIGGTTHNDVWSSENGKDWKQVTASAPWPIRRGACVVVYARKLWVVGGLDHNDAWSSTDGKNWRQVFGPAPWSTRGAEHSVVFHDALWLYGGKTGRSDSWQESGDVWRMRIVNGSSLKPQLWRDVSLSSFWSFLPIS